MKNNSSYVMFNRCIAYMFRSLLLTLRTYIYVLLLPLVVVTLLYFLTYNSIIANRSYLLFSSYLLLPAIFSFFLIGYIVCDWRESIFLKQLNNFGISRLKFIIALLVVDFVIVFISVFVVICYMLLLDCFKNHHIAMKWINQMVTFNQWFGLLLTVVLNIMVVYFIGLLISGALKNFYFIQTLNILLVAAFVVFGDFFIDMSYATNRAVIIISFFFPQKYLTWINYIFYTQSDKDYFNFFKILVNPDSLISFSSLAAPIACPIVVIIGTACGSYFAISAGARQ